MYTAESQALAVLEILVHLGAADPLESYALIPVQIDEKFVIRIEVSELPPDWRNYPSPKTLQDIGDEWVRSGRSAVLQVPSALLPSESNFVLNPTHFDFKRLGLGESIPFDFDSRMLK